MINRRNSSRHAIRRSITDARSIALVDPNYRSLVIPYESLDKFRNGSPAGECSIDGAIGASILDLEIQSRTGIGGKCEWHPVGNVVVDLSSGHVYFDTIHEGCQIGTID